MSNRILETVTGYDEAIRAIKNRAAVFDAINGAGRMQIVGGGLEAWDVEDSGEFYSAVCLNINEAEDCAHEIYQIETSW